MNMVVESNSRRSKTKITVHDGEPRKINGFVVTVRRRPGNGRRYCVIIEDAIQKNEQLPLTPSPPINKT